jgi:hypothetical protein
VTEPRPSFFARIFLAIAVYFRVLFDAEFAAGVRLLRRGELPPPEEEPEPEPEPEPPKLEERAPEAAMQLLSILQREGRFIDFLEEDVTSFSDAEVGAAARVVHDGCKKAVDEHFTIQPIKSEEEGSKVTVEAGFDASAVRLTGNVVGEPPYSGTLQHRGWRVVKVQLPKIAEDHDVSVVAPAEVEL